MLSLEGNMQQFTDLHEALAEGGQVGCPTSAHPGLYNSRHSHPHTAVWAPPSTSSHSRDSSMDSPMWPPATAGAAAFHPPNPPAVGAAFAGAAASRPGPSPLQPPWAPQTAARQSGYSQAGHDSSAPIAGWTPHQLPTPFGGVAIPATSAPGGYWNAPAPLQAGQGRFNQPSLFQGTHIGGADLAAARVGGRSQHGPDGRPPCAILSFGFGGRGVLVRSQASASEASAYGFGGERVTQSACCMLSLVMRSPERSKGIQFGSGVTAMGIPFLLPLLKNMHAWLYRCLVMPCTVRFQNLP